MPNAFDELLNATINHLEDLKRQGNRFVQVKPENMAALNTAARGKKSPAAKPAPAFAAPAKAPALSSPASPTPRPAVSKPQTVSPVVEAAPLRVEAAPAPIILAATGDKAADIAALRERAMVCVKCPHLASSRKNVVWGVGDINSPLMFVGEAPGADEDAQGEPFVGRAGQLLTKIIEAMGFTRNTAYIANILKCRPDTPGQSAGNRPPTPDEIKNCLPYLNAQIDLIQPKAIVALGATAVAGLFGKSAPISKIRGSFMTFRNIPVMPTFHPSYLLRPNGFSAKPLVWQDMLLVLEKLGRPISEKQRGYFKAGS